MDRPENRNAFTHSELKAHVDKLNEKTYADHLAAAAYLEDPTKEKYPKDLVEAMPGYLTDPPHPDRVVSQPEKRERKLFGRRKLGRKTIETATVAALPADHETEDWLVPAEVIYDHQVDKTQSMLDHINSRHQNVNAMDVLHELAIDDAKGKGVELKEPKKPELDPVQQWFGEGEKIYILPPSGHS